MGMFDYLRCEMPLPVPNAEGLEFQTKDLDCSLDHYVIKPDGMLWVSKFLFDVERGPEIQALDVLGRFQFYAYIDGDLLIFEAAIVYGRVDEIRVVCDNREYA